MLLGQITLHLGYKMSTICDEHLGPKPQLFKYELYFPGVGGIQFLFIF